MDFDTSKVTISKETKEEILKDIEVALGHLRSSAQLLIGVIDRINGGSPADQPIVAALKKKKRTSSELIKKRDIGFPEGSSKQSPSNWEKWNRESEG